VLYWFKLVRDLKTKQAEFIPHLIDDNSGVGMQVAVGHLQGNVKRNDIAISNKKGTFVFINKVKR